MPYITVDDNMLVEHAVEYKVMSMDEDVDRRYLKEKVVATRLTKEEAEAMTKLLNATN